MHTLGLIFAWTLVILFAIGMLGSSLLALESLWDGFSAFRQPPRRSRPTAE